MIALLSFAGAAYAPSHAELTSPEYVAALSKLPVQWQSVIGEAGTKCESAFEYALSRAERVMDTSAADDKAFIESIYVRPLVVLANVVELLAENYARGTSIQPRSIGYFEGSTLRFPSHIAKDSSKLVYWMSLSEDKSTEILKALLTRCINTALPGADIPILSFATHLTFNDGFAHEDAEQFISSGYIDPSSFPQS